MLSVSRLLTGTVSEADALRYGRRSGQLPSHLLHYSEDKKPVVVWTTTQRCNLHCAHCYTDSFDKEYPDELTTDEALAMVEDLAALGSPVLLISGGEPLRRPDLMTVAGRAVELGMRIVLSTNGTLLTPQIAEELSAVGFSYVGVSIDGRPETHDKFRGHRNAFDEAMAGLAACRDVGLKTGLRFTLTKQNQDDLPWVFDLMEERDIHRLCVYHLAPTGRGAKIAKFTPDHEETRAALDLIFDRCEDLAARGFEPEVLTADNHADAGYMWMRVAREQPERAEEVWRLLQWNGGNRSGQAIANVNSDGTVFPDQFWRWRPLGNIRERPFSAIYGDEPHEFLRELRARPAGLPDRCQGCRFLSICNGNFRSRAEAITGDLWGDDPLCYLTDEEVAGVAPVTA